MLNLQISLSLSLLLWQVLTAQPLPTAFTPADLMVTLNRESNRMKALISECLNADRPSKRPRASDVAARLLKEYNDNAAHGKARANLSLALLSRCRQPVDDCRRNHSTPPKEKLAKEDVTSLIDLQDSWDERGSDLRLAPEVSFLLGIYWGLIDVNDAQVPFSVVGRGTGTRNGMSGRHEIALVSLRV
jgi:hypothetical protein